MKIKICKNCGYTFKPTDIKGWDDYIQCPACKTWYKREEDD